MRYLIGILVTVGLIILVIFLLLSGRGSNAPAKATGINIEKYSNSAAAQATLIIDGPVVANQDHKTVKIDVTDSNVTLTVYQGYDQNVITTQSFANNQRSFAVFLHSLQLNGYSQGNTDNSLRDERGHCALGTRSIYRMTDDAKELFRFWSTGCGSGTFKGQSVVVANLFRSQVPGYNDLTQGTDL